MHQCRYAVSAIAAGFLTVWTSEELPSAQQDATNPVAATAPSSVPPDQPVTIVTASQRRLRVVPLARGLSHPWGMALLPDGKSVLVTERPGRLRIVRDGVLDPSPISGTPAVNPTGIGGLNDVAIHPDFSRNRLVYLSYAKNGERGVTLALARGRLDGAALVDVRDILVAEAWEAEKGQTGNSGTFGGRMLFGPDGLLYVTVGDRDVRVISDDATVRSRAQSLGSHIGKVLRLRDDGSVPDDNPFIGRADALPEIFTYGHRNAYGLAFHPQSGALWECEFGPMGGDELNVLVAGQNYGWPLVSVGRNYSGAHVSEQPWWRPGMEMPAYVWNPSVNPTNILFYTGTAFVGWRNSLLVSGLGSKQVQRLTLNRSGLVVGQPESLLGQLGLRFRDIRQGRDGALYVLTEGRPQGNDDADGAVLRIEPAPEDARASQAAPLAKNAVTTIAR
jgi:glucose/arabinose dehydrogenase